MSNRIDDVVKTWIRETIQSGRYREFRDLHIDMVHREFKSRDQWVNGSYRCLGSALLARNRLGVPYTIAIGMSLVGGEAPLGLNFHDRKDLAQQLDSSPPSLYLLADDMCPWYTGNDVVELGSGFQLAGNLPTRAFLHEWWHENDGEHRRTVWIAG